MTAADVSAALGVAAAESDIYCPRGVVYYTEMLGRARLFCRRPSDVVERTFAYAANGLTIIEMPSTGAPITQ